MHPIGLNKATRRALAAQYLKKAFDLLHSIDEAVNVAEEVAVEGTGNAGLSLICIECAEDFTLTAGHVDWYRREKKLALPKRCSECRRSRREGKS